MAQKASGPEKIHAANKPQAAKKAVPTKKKSVKKPVKKKAPAKAKASAKPAAKSAQPKKEKYLVTGACGFVGSHICQILGERGLDYIATDLPGASSPFLPADAKFIPSDVTKPETLAEVVKGCTVVLHPAAIFDWSVPREILEAVNVKGTENVCIAARNAGAKRLVSWSTSGVYGNQKFDNLPILENYPKKPLEDYSITKLMQDEVVNGFNDRGELETSIIRPGVVYGPGAKYGAAQVFDAFAILPVIPVPVNFDYRFGTVHVRDIAGAAIYVSTQKDAAGETFGVVDCSAISIAEFFKLIANAMGKPAVPIFVPPMLSRELGLVAATISEWFAKNVTKTKPLLERGPIQFFPVDMYISNQKLLDLGYQYEYPTPDRGVRETVEWMSENGFMDMSVIDLIKRISER